jgi:hypothetical protein
MSGLEIRLEHVATIAPTGSGPLTRINGATNGGDGSGRLFVPDLRGEIFVIDGGAPSAFLDVTTSHPDFTASQGLSSGLSWVTFDPDFASNGRFYTAHTEDGTALTAHTPDFPHQLGHTIHGIVTEWTATVPGANTFAGTSRELLRVGFVSNFHGIQQIEFGPDGLLYIGIGDGDSTTFSTGAQSLDYAQGKLLQIDPAGNNSANGEYGIPTGNPYAALAGLDEIYARGFRNPHRADRLHRAYLPASVTVPAYDRQEWRSRSRPRRSARRRTTRSSTRSRGASRTRSRRSRSSFRRTMSESPPGARLADRAGSLRSRS